MVAKDVASNPHDFILQYWASGQGGGVLGQVAADINVVMEPI